MTVQDNERLIEQAQSGNDGPLLAKLRGGAQTSAGTGGIIGQDGGVADQIWYQVLNADLPKALMNKCYDAVGAGKGAGPTPQRRPPRVAGYRRRR